MKYIKFTKSNQPCWGVLDGDQVTVLTAPPYEGGTATEETCSYAQLEANKALLAPCCSHGKVVCVGKNYYDHAMEMGDGVPEIPILFLKTANTINNPHGDISAPSFVTRLDYEGELAMVISKKAKDVKAEDFADYVLGYTCLNDVTARDIQKSDGQWSRGKAMDGFAPIGPFLTDEVDPDNLPIETRLNGKVVQSSNTSAFMTKTADLFAFITASMTLEPGDVVTTGTPAGIGPMVAGDVVEVEITGIGVLTNQVI